MCQVKNEINVKFEIFLFIPFEKGKKSDFTQYEIRNK